MPKITLLPRLSEKSYGLSSQRIYVVDIDRRMNKHEIARTIESQFSVKVSKVNLTNITGKAKRSISKSGRRVSRGYDNSIKKAYVTLAEGHTLPFFAVIEEEEKKAEETQAKVEKAIAKEQQKDEKTTKRGRLSKALKEKK